LNITSPFEANYDFEPLVHPDPWPSFFVVDRPIPGLLQRWRLTARLASFADEPLHVENVNLTFENKPEGIICKLVERLDTAEAGDIAPKTMRSFRFIVDTVRPGTKEQQRAQLNQVKLNITWSRMVVDATTVTSTILVPSLPLPPLEPRVIATADHVRLGASSSTSSSPTVKLPQSPSISPDDSSTPLTVLSLYLENPTPHPLTFDIAVPSSESLAFSGPKQQAATLLPYSRTDITFRLLPMVKAGTWVVFGVKVQDRYFVRDVGVLAGEGVESEDEGGVRWLVE
jgi:solute carrier family 25 protein 38